jgi:hypothetical protein
MLQHKLRFQVMDKGDIDKMSTAAKSSQEGDSNKEEL